MEPKLHLFFALSFEKLADDMIKTIKDKWTNPFEPPIVIFPDRVLEQWFKLRWMEKEGVIANLNTKFIDEFIFEILAKDKKVSRLKPSVLGEIVAAWLRDNLCDCDDTLWAEVKHYLMSDNSIDEIRLYDFAKMMSGLFVEYETSRPDNFMGKPGIMQCWKDGNVKFFNHDKADAWQRELYRKLFVGDDSWCNKVAVKLSNEASFKTLPSIYEESGLSKDNLNVPVFLLWHAALGQFYRKVIDDYAAQGHDVYAYIQNPCMEFWEDVEKRSWTYKIKTNEKDRPKYFIDSLNMGDDGKYGFERERPGDENKLLVDWGTAGRENISLWCQSSNYDFNFTGIENLTETDEQFNQESHSLLRQIQHNIARRSGDKDIIISNDDNAKIDKSLTISAAPSKIREVEHLHSQICRLMHDKDAKIKDILIVAPNINEYRTAIYQVFAQSANWVKETSRGAVREDALHIPFTILDGTPRESLTASALRVLFKIVERKTLMRPDFFALVRNPLVQKVRGFAQDEVDNWQNWVYQLNVYRDRQKTEKLSEREDWSMGVKRLLMAKLSNVCVDDNGKKILPFGDIASNDNDSLCRFIDCVDDLEDICQKVRGVLSSGLTENDLKESFMPFVNRWISLKSVPKSLTAENVIYQSVIERVSELKYQYAAMNDNAGGTIPWKYLEQALCGAAESSNYTSGSIFVNGLTFMNFTPARVLPVKHLFMLGMEASAFPGHANRSSLDLRRFTRWPGDTEPTSRNRYAFLCQLMSISESLHISYVNQDLKKDEEFYPSSVVNDLMDYIRESLQTRDEDEIGEAFKCIEYDIPLDEMRDLPELFTSRELRNRRLYQLLMSEQTKGNVPENGVIELSVDTVGNLPERVPLWLIKKYLDDPFQMRVAQLLNDDDYDPDEDPERVMYEPVDIDDFALTSIVKEIAQEIIHKEIHASESGIQCETSNSQIGVTAENNGFPDYADIRCMIDEYFEQLNSQNQVFEKVYEKVIRQRIEKYANVVADQIRSRTSEYELAYQDSFEVEMVCEYQGKFYYWTLVANRPEWHTRPEEDKTGILHVAAVKMTKFEGKIHEYLSAYTTALACLARLCQEGWDKEINVCLEVYSAQDNKPTDGLSFSLTPMDAVNTLNAIYAYAFVEQLYEAAPMKIVENDKAFKDNPDDKSEHDTESKDNSNEEKGLKSLDDLKEKLMGFRGVWKFFKKAHLFIDGNLGYDDSRFKKQWSYVVGRQKALVEPITQACTQKEAEKKAAAEERKKKEENDKFVAAKIRQIGDIINVKKNLVNPRTDVEKLITKYCEKKNTKTTNKSAPVKYCALKEACERARILIHDSEQEVKNKKIVSEQFCKTVLDANVEIEKAELLNLKLSELFKEETNEDIDNVAGK